MKRLPELVTFLWLAAVAAPAVADLTISTIGVPEVITFDATKAGVNNGQYTGTGFDPGATTVGRLDSNGWAITGVAGVSLEFGGTRTSGEFARGTSTVGVSSDGVWAFDVDNNPNATDRAFGIRPSDADFTPGTITLRIKNDTGTTVESWSVSYDIYVWNNQNRSNSLNLLYSTDGMNFTAVPALDFATPQAADPSPSWVKTPRSTEITATVLSAGQFYLRWFADDVSGSGQRDSYGFDNISVTANAIPEPGAALFGAVILLAIGLVKAGQMLSAWRPRRP